MCSPYKVNQKMVIKEKNHTPQGDLRMVRSMMHCFQTSNNDYKKKPLFFHDIKIFNFFLPEADWLADNIYKVYMSKCSVKPISPTLGKNIPESATIPKQTTTLYSFLCMYKHMYT